MIFSESESEPDAPTLCEWKNGAFVPLKQKTSRKHSPAAKKRAANYAESIIPSPVRRKRQTRTPKRYDGSPLPILLLQARRGDTQIMMIPGLLQV